MKIKGKSVTPPTPKVCIIPREGDDIIFQCGAVLDYSSFNELVKEPVPPLIQKVGSAPEKDLKDARYLQAIDNYVELKMSWMILTSLSLTEGLEWDTVQMNDPNTWANYSEELKQVFTEQEVATIINTVMLANVPDENRQKEALNRFVASQAAKE